MDQDACYHKLVGWLHPDSLDCPKCKTDDHLHVHRRHRAPILDYRCTACGRVFNAFTATALAGTHRTPAEIMLINTMERTWTGPRNFLRPFRGVSKWYLSRYVAMFQWGHNIKEVSDQLVQVMLGMGPYTEFAP